MSEEQRTEPDYTLTIEEKDGFVVYEGGIEVSISFETRQQAEDWAEFRRRWDQPYCCGCGSSISYPDDPWDYVGVDRYGPDWMHKSCKEKLLRGQVAEQNRNSFHIVTDQQ
jgi:hypothetical protein